MGVSKYVYDLFIYFSIQLIMIPNKLKVNVDSTQPPHPNTTIFLPLCRMGVFWHSLLIFKGGGKNIKTPKI